jgi:hypothetical protein
MSQDHRSYQEFINDKKYVEALKKANLKGKTKKQRKRGGGGGGTNWGFSINSK